MTAHATVLNAPVRIGCSGWINKHWRGLFYPDTLPVKRWFAYYADAFDTVGWAHWRGSGIGATAER